MQDKQATVSQLEGHTAALQAEISALKQNKDDVSLCHIHNTDRHSSMCKVVT